MVLSKELNDWYSKFQFTFFNYKDGFFHLKYESKTPAKMIDSFARMPFVKFDKKKKEILTSNPLMKVEIRYFEIQDGLWLMVSKANYKTNIVFNSQFDETDKEEYYFLNLHFKNVDCQNKTMLLNGIPINNKVWTVVKPKANRILTHFKNATDKNITLFFRKDFLKSDNKSLNFIQTGLFDTFFESANDYLSSIDDESNEFLYDAFVKILKQKDGEEKTQSINTLVNQFCEMFVTSFQKDKLSENYFSLPDHDRKNILKVEEILSENLMISFPGIEQLAASVGISPTKLKNDFKAVHGTSIFQYFRNNQLDMAYTVLKNKSLKIKQIANLFGYENASKFSAAFKEKFDVTPSDLMV